MNEIIKLFDDITAIYHCNNCNNDFNILNDNMVNGKYRFVCPYCFSRNYYNYDDFKNKNNKKVYTDIMIKFLKSLKSIKVKNHSKRLIKTKITNHYKGFVYFFYDNNNFKIIPLHKVNPYLYIKEPKKLYKLYKPYSFINGKPIFRVYIKDSCSKDYITDINSGLEIDSINNLKELKESIRIYSLRKFLNKESLIMLFMIISFLIIANYLIIRIIFG